MKKKLVLDLGDDRSSFTDLPQQYTISKHRWVCEVISEDPSGIVTEYDITPDGKLLLGDFFGLVNEKFGHIMADDDSSWSCKIFRLVKKK